MGNDKIGKPEAAVRPADRGPQTIVFEPFVFHKYTTPLGFLQPEAPSQALWYYYVCARRTYEELVEMRSVQYEGTPDQVPNFRQLFESIATIYGVSPDAMAKCWPQVDMQCVSLGLPQLPNVERYRFDKTPSAN